MSATSGISPSPELTAQFADAVESKSIRFIKVSIQNESLIPDGSWPIVGSFEDDLNILQGDEVIQSNVPAYILVKLDQPSADWLAIFYVPDDAKVRDKMLYASSRANLVKHLGSTVFTDSIFATSKEDLTPSAYRAHQLHQAAPKPLSSREQEAADARQAENAAATYAGSRATASHIGAGVGLNWSPEAEQAVAQLAEGDQTSLVILSIDPPTETLLLKSSTDLELSDLPSALPPSEPCYALLAWPHGESAEGKREIVFIYSCPSSSPIKHRMLYSSGSGSTFTSVKGILGSSVAVASRKIETSDPKEVDESFLKTELGRTGEGSASTEAPNTPSARPFAKPRGPGRRR